MIARLGHGRPWRWWLLWIGRRRRHEGISRWLRSSLSGPLHSLRCHLGSALKDLFKLASIKPDAAAGWTIVDFNAVALNNDELGDSVNGTGSQIVHGQLRPSALIQVLQASERDPPSKDACGRGS